MSEEIVAALPYSRVITWSEAEPKHERAACDARAFVTQHYLELRQPILRFLRWRVRSHADAEELAQEVFLRLYVHVREGHQVTNVRAWIFAVARNAIIDRRRESRADPIHAAAAPIDVASTAEGSDDRFERLRRDALIEAAIATLPPLQRQCMALRADGLRLREVAAALNCTISTVASSLQRATTNIRRQLDHKTRDRRERSSR